MVMYHDLPYLNLVRDILSTGCRKSNRTGVDVLSVFSRQMRFNLSDGSIPLLTTKKMFTRGVIRELLWYFMGDGNISYLKEHKVTIWDEWADQSGNLGPVYGVMWRKWPEYVWNEQANCHEVRHVDQVQRLINSLRVNPLDRRLLITAWNPALLPDGGLSFEENVARGKQALPPCHYTFQFYTRPLSVKERIYTAGRKYHPNEILEYTTDQTVEGWLDEVNIPKYELSLMLNQRSCDVGLGVPFNIVQYSLLLRMVCEVVNMQPGEFVWNGGDVHIYENHVPALTEQLSRDPFPSPTFSFARPVLDIDDFKYEDFIIHNYTSHPTLTMEVAV